MATIDPRNADFDRWEALRHLAWRFDTRIGMVSMFVVAFAIRLLIAPHVGYHDDLQAFSNWTKRLAAVGPGGFYAQEHPANYPPGYLYVLWLTGKVVGNPGYVALKMPALLGDLVLAWIAGILAGRLAPHAIRESWPVRTVAMAAVLFNPAVLGVSAVWGQVDVVPAVFVLGSLLLLFTGPKSLRREVIAFALFAIAIALKPHSGFVLPVMLYALYRRHLHRKAPNQLIAGAFAIGLCGVVSLGIWLTSGLPFGLNPAELVSFYRDAASSTGTSTSVSAFNLWGALGFWRADSIGDGAMTIAGISALRFGLLAFLAGVAFILWQLHRAIEHGANEARALTVAASSAALLAFAVLTRMHERYLFFGLAILVPLLFERHLRWALAGLSALFVLNLWWPYAFQGWHNGHWAGSSLHVQPWFDWLYGAAYGDDTWQRKLWSFAVVAIVLAVAVRGQRWVGAPQHNDRQSDRRRYSSR